MIVHTGEMKKIIPKYAIAPILVMLAVNTYTYYVTPIWTNQMKHYCLESWICYRSSRDKRYFGNKYKITMGLMTALVFLSTVLIKQHLFIDIVVALIVAEIGLVISRFCVAKVYKNEIG